MTNLEKVLDGTYLISPKDLKPLMFFSEKYGTRHVSAYGKQLMLGRHIFKFCKLLFKNENLMLAISLFREALIGWEKDRLKKTLDRRSTTHFVKAIEELEDFYDLNINAGPGAQDKRIHIFERLKGRVNTVIKFLDRRTTPIKIRPLNHRAKKKHGPKMQDVKLAHRHATNKGRYGADEWDIIEEEKRFTRRKKEGF